MSYRAMMLIVTLAAASPLIAQDGAVVIDPGMTRAEVVERLGKPLNERKTGAHTYLFYRNGCERTCGMNDLVLLDDGKVSDAIFRSAGRHYSGASSSPNGVKPARSEGGAAGVATVRRAKRGGIVIARPADGGATATVTGVEVMPAEGAAPNGRPRPTPLSPEPVAAPMPPAATSGQRPILPVPLPGATVNTADSIRALTPDRPTAMPGAKINPADSIRAEAVRRQQADTTKKP